MAKVNDAKTTSIGGLRWFKISHSGLLSGGRWASDDVNAAGGRYNFRIPSSIAAGQYLLRGETIGLHVAQNTNGAQFYMYVFSLKTKHFDEESLTRVYRSCVQLQVTGGGGSNPGGVSFPGAYSASHPGIQLNIYYPPLTSYSIPGPSPVS